MPSREKRKTFGFTLFKLSLFLHDIPEGERGVSRRRWIIDRRFERTRRALSSTHTQKN